MYAALDSGAEQRRKVIKASSDSSADPPRIILKPKLQAPAPRPEQIVRPRLLTLLEESSDHKATLISAPAGCRKTTLLAQWGQAEEADLSSPGSPSTSRTTILSGCGRHIVEALRQAVPEEEFGADVLVGMSAAGQKLVEAPLPMCS